MSLANICLLPCLLAASCSSLTYQEDLALAADAADVGRLQQHMQALADLGPRRAGDPGVGEATVAYLERELAGLGIATAREVFVRTPGSKLVLHLEPQGELPDRLDIPGVYFGSTISQIRVVRGFVDAAGVGDRFDGYGLEAGTVDPVDQINLLATISGTIRPERILEVAAHHDTVPGTVGADDNTSGVAVLLEVARLLQQRPPACTVRLCFFAAEEIGLRGSLEHVRLMQAEGRQDEVFGLINIDGVGVFTDEKNSQSTPARIPFVVWPPRTGNFLAIIGANGSSALGGLIEDAGDLYVPDLRLYALPRIGGLLPDARRGDHANYWDADIPAILLTDTGEFRTDNYHRPSDDLSVIDMEALRDVAALTVASILAATEREAAAGNGDC
jgi:Peptidase family M28